MQSFHAFIARRSEVVHPTVTPATTDGGPSDMVINAMIALLSLVFFALVLVAVLVLLRRMRRQQQGQRAGRAGADPLLPQYYDAVAKRPSGNNHRGLTIHTAPSDAAAGPRHSVVVIDRATGRPMLANPTSPPHSPDNVPEIHITFPDEHDDQGRRKSGRVVVVRVGDATVGMEPLHGGEQLPAYEKESKTQFYAIDIDHIGGLKEKDRSTFQ